MSDDKALTLLEKVAAIQRNIAAVTVREFPGENGDEPDRYAPAEDVFKVVRTQLRRQRLVAIPQVVSSDKRAGATSVRLAIELVDLDDENESMESTWEGEATGPRAVASAITSALKTFYLATFQIRVEAVDAKARRKAKRDTGEPRLIGDDEGRLGSLQDTATKSGLDDDELAKLLFERHGIRELGHVPFKRSVELTDTINEAGKLKAAGRDPLTRAA